MICRGVIPVKSGSGPSTTGASSRSAASKARRRVSDLEVPQRFVSRSQRATVAGSKATVVRIVMVAIIRGWYAHTGTRSTKVRWIGKVLWVLPQANPQFQLFDLGSGQPERQTLDPWHRAKRFTGTKGLTTTGKVRGVSETSEQKAIVGAEADHFHLERRGFAGGLYTPEIMR